MNSLLRSASLVLIAISFSVLSAGQDNRSLARDGGSLSERRLALIIGNGKYADAPLKNPANDATDMAAALKAVGFEVMSYTDLDQTAMKRAIREFGTKLRSAGGVGLFYYAGHGVQVKGVNYLIPVGAAVNTEEEVEYESVDAGLVLAQMESARNQMNIVILDACRNNPFARSYRSGDKGLAQINAPSGTLIAYSTAPGSVASDGSGRNGLYTRELLRQIRTGGRSIEEVFKQVRISVRQATSEKQTPWESSSLTGAFYFVGQNAKLPVLDAPLVPDRISVEKSSAKRQYEHWQAMLKRNLNSDVIAETSAEIAKDPKNAVAFRMRSSGYARSRKADLARSDAEEIVRILQTASTAEDYDALCYANNYVGKPENGIDNCTAAIKIDNGMEWAYVNRGRAYLAKEQYDHALADFTRALEIDPSFASSYVGRGDVFARQSKWEQAIADYGRSIELEPSNPSAYAARGWGYAQKSMFHEALADFSKAVEADPNWAQGYVYRAEMYKQKQQFDKAIEDYDKAIGLDPKLSYAYGNRGETYFLLKKNDLALADYATAIQIDPKNAEAYFDRARLYGDLKRDDLALADYNKVIEINPKATNAYNRRGHIYLDKSLDDRALADFTKAVEIEPKNIAAIVGRGLVFGRKKLWDQAILEYTKAIGIDAASSAAYRGRAWAYWGKRERALAKSDEKKAETLEKMEQPKNE